MLHQLIGSPNYIDLTIRRFIVIFKNSGKKDAIRPYHYHGEVIEIYPENYFIKRWLLLGRHLASTLLHALRNQPHNNVEFNSSFIDSNQVSTQKNTGIKYYLHIINEIRYAIARIITHVQPLYRSFHFYPYLTKLLIKFIIT